MRIVSLLPAATEIVCALGLDNQLLGISHGCYYPTTISNKPRISFVDVDYEAMSSEEIDCYVEEKMHAKKSLYRLDKKLLEEIQPTHILTQALCDVCAITPSDIHKVIKDLSPMPEILELNPRSIEQIYDDIVSLGETFHQNTKAKQIVKDLKKKITAIKKKTQSLKKKTVFCLEWLEPLYACGHWVPEMIEIAGGIDPLSFPNQYSSKIAWDNVIKADPEVIILMPCSFSIKRTIQELPVVTDLSFWRDLRAVKNNTVWIADGTSFFNQSGIRTVDKGIELLAKIIHPELLGYPEKHEAVNIATITKTSTQ